VLHAAVIGFEIATEAEEDAVVPRAAAQRDVSGAAPGLGGWLDALSRAWTRSGNRDHSQGYGQRRRAFVSYTLYVALSPSHAFACTRAGARGARRADERAEAEAAEEVDEEEEEEGAGSAVVVLRKRFSQFVQLRNAAIASGARLDALPQLPARVVLRNLAPSLIASRSAALGEFVRLLAQVEAARPAFERFCNADVLSVSQGRVGGGLAGPPPFY
jgi:hypothetical protein